MVKGVPIITEQETIGEPAASPTNTDEAHVIKVMSRDKNENAHITNGKNDTSNGDNSIQSETTEDTIKANEKAKTDRAVQLLMEISKDPKKRRCEDNNEEYRKHNKTSDTQEIEADQYTEYAHNGWAHGHGDRIYQP